MRSMPKEICRRYRRLTSPEVGCKVGRVARMKLTGLESGFSGLTDFFYNNIPLLVWLQLSLAQLLPIHFSIYNILRMLDTHPDASSEYQAWPDPLWYQNTAKKAKMKPVNDREDPPAKRHSKAVEVVQSVWRFCLANWLIFAFGFATLMAYLFPREYTILLLPTSTTSW